MIEGEVLCFSCGGFAVLLYLAQQRGDGLASAPVTLGIVFSSDVMLPGRTRGFSLLVAVAFMICDL